MMGAATYPRMMKKAAWASLPWSVILVCVAKAQPCGEWFSAFEVETLKETQMVENKRGRQKG